MAVAAVAAVAAVVVCVSCMHSVNHLCAWCPRRPEAGIRFSGTGIADGCYLLCEYWELNSEPLEERPVFLIAKPSL